MEEEIHSNYEKLAITKSAYSKVTLYYWEGREGNPGHISMKTYIGGPNNKGHYVSFWPERKPLLLVEIVTAYQNRTYNEDMVAENFAPQEINLYTLDVLAINEEYEKFIEMGRDWWLLSALKVLLNEEIEEKDQCCSSLVMDLLFVGGIASHIEELVTPLNLYLSVDGGMKDFLSDDSNTRYDLTATLGMFVFRSMLGTALNAINFISKRTIIFSPQSVFELVKAANISEEKHFRLVDMHANEENNFQCQLSLACKLGNMDWAKKLLEQGYADVDYEHNLFLHPVQGAFYSLNFTLLKYLVSQSNHATRESISDFLIEDSYTIFDEWKMARTLDEIVESAPMGYQFTDLIFLAKIGIGKMHGRAFEFKGRRWKRQDNSLFGFHKAKWLDRRVGEGGRAFITDESGHDETVIDWLKKIDLNVQEHVQKMRDYMTILTFNEFNERCSSKDIVELTEACKLGDLSKVRALVEKDKIDINHLSSDSKSCIACACYSLNSDLVIYMLRLANQETLDHMNKWLESNKDFTTSFDAWKGERSLIEIIEEASEMYRFEDLKFLAKVGIGSIVRGFFTFNGGAWRKQHDINLFSIFVRFDWQTDVCLDSGNISTNSQMVTWLTNIQIAVEERKEYLLNLIKFCIQDPSLMDEELNKKDEEICLIL